MTPHPIHVPRRALRPSVALCAALLVIGGTPLVARALDDDATPAATPVAAGALEPSSTSPLEQPIADDPEPIADLGASLDDATGAEEPLEAEPVAETEPPMEVDQVARVEQVTEAIAAPAAVSGGAVAQRTTEPVVAVLTAPYLWDEKGPRIVVLQEALGVAVDGWYGRATLEAHRAMLQAFGLSTATLPTPPPPGPSADQWAALRQCESSGNYSITNPSGKYRGAYQFDRPTWNSVAARHAPQLVGVDPAAASPADQDAMARALYSDRGASPWPRCGRYLS
jgi:hypothetical protein